MIWKEVRAICRLEWDLLAGLMHRPMLILTPVPPIRCGRGGVAGEEAGAVGVVGAVVGGVGSAGAGWHPIGIPGGKTIT